VSTERRAAAVFLDRDGVLIPQRLASGSLAPPDSAGSLELLPGVAQACLRLHDDGLLLFVVTNQPDVARGIIALADVETIHRRLRELLPIDHIYVCPHDEIDACDCRKPRPGMLLEAARQWGVDLRASTMVGDRWRDIEAGQRAGCATVYIPRGYPELKPEFFDATANDLTEAADFILERRAAVTPGSVEQRT
jgi:D-glycero-D-manno-heptose 1,7-bisphosphate phosphatase